MRRSARPEKPLLTWQELEKTRETSFPDSCRWTFSRMSTPPPAPHPHHFRTAPARRRRQSGSRGRRQRPRPAGTDGGVAGCQTTIGLCCVGGQWAANKLRNTRPVAIAMRSLGASGGWAGPYLACLCAPLLLQQRCISLSQLALRAAGKAKHSASRQSSIKGAANPPCRACRPAANGNLV